MMIDMATVKADRHAAGYAPVLEDNPKATDAFFARLNQPETPTALTVASRLGHPALSGVVEDIEAEPSIAAVLDVARYRQAVGVVIRLCMDQLGWHTTGKKATVKGATRFGKAEVYAP
jgi:hypothetical protein